MVTARRGERFGRGERLRSRLDFEVIAREGVRRQSAHFLIITRGNDLGFSRLGVIASKRIGKAVERNRVKRLMREFFRRHKELLDPSTDYVIIGKGGVKDLTYDEVKDELSPLLLRRLRDKRKG